MSLEQRGVQLGESRFLKSQEEAPLPDSAVGQNLIDRILPNLIRDLDNFRNMRGRGKFAVVRSLDIDTLDLAYISLRAVLTHIDGGCTVQSLASSIGREVQEHIRYLKWTESNHKQAVALEKYLDTHPGQSRLRLFDKNMDIEFNLGSEVRRSTGLLIIELLVDYGFLTSYKRNQRQLVRLSDKVMELFDELINNYKGLLPIKLPMVVEPKDWSTMFDGGYLTIKSPLIHIKEHSAYSDYPDNTIPFEAINKLQKVSWRINKPILRILEKLEGSGVGGLPLSKDRQPEPLTIPPETYQRLKDTDSDELKKLLYERRLQKNLNMIEDSHRINLSLKLWVARTMESYDKLWFTPFLDYRGRFYYSQSYLSPQGDDINRALLEFGDGKPVDPEVLQINLANLYGVDKVSFADRVKWTLENENKILESAKDPEDNQWWTEADEPWQFLAAALDYYSYKSNPEHLSHLPVWIDGTCNGLQHYGALLRDLDTAQEVNLVNREIPGDIYARVAESTYELVKNDPKALRDHDVWTYRNFWLDKIDRSLVKRPVMTLPYGVTFYGVKQQLIEDNKQDNPQFFGNLSAGKAAEYLARKIMEAMSMHIRGAVEGMQWLQEIASIVGPSEISWFTPDNFYVIQSYKTVSKTRIETIFGKKVVRLWFVEPTTKINVSKQKGGIAPNFIHSLDATHLRMVASEFLDDNRSLGVIHDSFSTHSCDIPELSRVIRDKFYELHSNDIMRDFKDQIEQQIQKKLPEPPEKGDYNLQEIYQSDYFFS